MTFYCEKKISFVFETLRPKSSRNDFMLVSKNLNPAIKINFMKDYNRKTENISVEQMEKTQNRFS